MPTEAAVRSGELPAHRKILLILGAAIGLASGFAGLYFSTLAIFLKPMAADLGWSRGDTSAATLISMLGLSVGSPLQGLLIDRWGARRVIGLSVLMFAAALLGFSLLLNSRLMLGVISFAMGALTVATGPTGYLSVLPRWFNRRLGLAFSLAMIGVGLGGIFMPKLTQALIPLLGWRGAYRWLSLIALIGGTCAYILLRAGEEPGAARAVNTSPNAPTRPGATLYSAFRDHHFWIIASVMFIGSAAGLGIVIHLAALLDDRGTVPALAANAVALGSAGVLLGRFAGGALMDMIFAPRLGAAAYALAAVGTLLVMTNLFDSFAMVGLGAVLVGLSIGAEGDFVAFAVRRYFGMRAFGSIYGCLMAAYALGGVVGPVLFGVAFDKLGNYRLALTLSTAAFLLLMLLISTLGAYRFGTFNNDNAA